MCIVVAPAVMAAIAIASTVASAGVAIASAQQQANSAQSAANYQAQVARNNQIVANQNAQATQDAGEAAVTNERLKTAAMIGSQRAALASNGVDMGSGSALDVQGSTASVGEADALTIRNNAARQAYGQQVQGINLGNQATLDTAQGQWAQSAAGYQMAGSVLGAASSVGTQWAGYQQKGIFDKPATS